jgi:hypothetical protein
MAHGCHSAPQDFPEGYNLRDQGINPVVSSGNRNTVSCIGVADSNVITFSSTYTTKHITTTTVSGDPRH